MKKPPGSASLGSELEPQGLGSPVDQHAADAQEPVGRAPSNIAGVVGWAVEAVVTEPVEQQPLDLGGHLRLLGFVETVFAELDEHPDVGSVDVPWAGQLVRHLHTLQGRVSSHEQDVGVVDEEAGKSLAEHRDRQLVDGIEPRLLCRVVRGLAGDLDEGHGGSLRGALWGCHRFVHSGR